MAEAVPVYDPSQWWVCSGPDPPTGNSIGACGSCVPVMLVVLPYIVMAYFNATDRTTQASVASFVGLGLGFRVSRVS